MDGNNLLFLYGFLRRLLLFIVPELPLVVPSFCLIGGGWHRDMAGLMINENSLALSKVVGLEAITLS